MSTDILVKTASNEINNLTKKDAFILWGGSNYVGNNSSKAGLRNICQFAKNNSHTNILLMGVPHRFDLPDTSCVNKEVDSFNNKLAKIVKSFKFATLLRVEQRREHFTRHGMHLKATGKASAAKLIVNLVNSIFIQKREKPVTLGWKDIPNDCMSVVNDDKQDGFPLLTSTSNNVNNNDFVNNSNSRMCGQVMANLDCSVSHSSSKEHVTKAVVNKTSGRTRRAHVTKSNAFLW